MIIIFLNQNKKNRVNKLVSNKFIEIIQVFQTHLWNLEYIKFVSSTSFLGYKCIKNLSSLSY